MSDQSSSAWPVICGVLAIVAAIASVIAIQGLVWKRRWQADNEMMSQELRAAAQKLGDEAYARVKAESQIAALQTKIEDLRKQLDDAQHKARPAP
jgi:TolA-binding protein